MNRQSVFFVISVALFGISIAEMQMFHGWDAILALIGVLVGSVGIVRGFRVVISK